MHDVQTTQGNMDNINNPVGQVKVKVKQNKLNTNNLEKYLTITQPKSQSTWNMSKVTDLTKRRYKIEKRKLVFKNINLPCHSFPGVMLPFLLVELDGLQPSSTSTITKLNREKR